MCNKMNAFFKKMNYRFVVLAVYFFATRITKFARKIITAIFAGDSCIIHMLNIRQRTYSSSKEGRSVIS